MAALGWSVSDLTESIKLICKVCKALRDTGGASSDYQQTVAFLQGLATTLDSVRTFNDIFASPEDAVFIRAQVDLVREPVEEFTRRIEAMFKQRLGTQAMKGMRGVVFGGHRKAQWALRFAKKAKNLSERIAAPLNAIQIALSVQMLTMLSEERKNPSSDVCNKATEALTNTIPDLLEHSIRPFREFFKTQGQAQMDYNIKMMHMIEETPQRVHQDTAAALQSMRLKDPRPQTCYSTHEQALSNHIEELKIIGRTLANIIDIHDKAQHDTILTRSQVACQNVWVEVGRNFRQFLCALAKAFQELFYQLWPLFTPLVLYLRTLKTCISQIPSLLLDNNISFTDALGRTRSLPNIYYRNWETFERFLRKDFEKIPGESQVLENRYHIMDHRGQIIERSRWQTFARPKARLSMAVILAMSATIGQCPKCRTLAAKAIARETINCSACNLEYSTGTSSRREPDGPRINKHPNEDPVESSASPSPHVEEEDQKVEGHPYSESKEEDAFAKEDEALAKEECDLKYFRKVYFPMMLGYPYYNAETLTSIFHPWFLVDYFSSSSLSAFTSQLIGTNDLSPNYEYPIDVSLGFGPSISLQVCPIIPRDNETMRNDQEHRGKAKFDMKDSLPIVLDLFSIESSAEQLDDWLEKIIDSRSDLSGYVKLITRRQKGNLSAQILEVLVSWFLTSESKLSGSTCQTFRTALKLHLITTVLNLIPKVTYLSTSLYLCLSSRSFRARDNVLPKNAPLLARQIKSAACYLQNKLTYALFSSHFENPSMVVAEVRLAVALIITHVLELVRDSSRGFARYSREIDDEVIVRRQDLIKYEADIENIIFERVQGSISKYRDGSMGVLREKLESLGSIQKGKWEAEENADLFLQL